jgi:hypothetical protein
MRVFSLFILLAVFASCKKGADYCELPMDFPGFKALPAVNDPSSPVLVEFIFSWEADLDWYEKGALFSFSVPNVFVNPKGEGRLSDVVTKASYTYILKDPANAPDSVVVSAYVFTDCGRSKELSTVIRYD